MFNVDGFGMVWYTYAQETFGEEVGPRPALYKHPQPPGNDLVFHSLCQNVSTTNVLAHIRMASATPVVAVNNHPFVFGRHTIMHVSRATHAEGLLG
jgi:glutamine amidotransferase